MDTLHKQALQITKEIVVKFIETGRISPASFPEHFPLIYQQVMATVVDTAPPAKTTDASASSGSDSTQQPG